jgi:multidrug efflux system membrane fusion protein
MRRLPLVLCIVAVPIAGAAFLLFSGASASAPQTPAAPPAPAVTVAPVEARRLAEHSEFTGRIEAIDDVEIRPRVSGYLDAVHFAAGQLVHKGDVLFTIDPRWNKAALESAEAHVQDMRVRLENAEREAKRASELLKSKAVSAEEAESRSARLAEARAAAQAADAADDTAKLDLEYTTVRAPVDGRIGRALVTPGNFVSGVPAAGTVLTTIVSIDPMYVYADVDEVSLLELKRLMTEHALPVDDHGRVLIEVGLSDEKGYPHAGAIESLDNRLDEGTGSIVLRAIVPNPDQKLVPGLFARVRLPSSAEKPTPLVPERAVGTDQSQKFVLVLGADDVVQYRAVELGPEIDGQLRIVRAGLEPGEKIVVNGLQRVRPGVKVSPHGEEPSANAKPDATGVHREASGSESSAKHGESTTDAKNPR